MLPRTLLLSVAIAAGLPSLAFAQGWGALIDQQWPGAAIRKVSEREFCAFVTAHASAGTLREARTEFLSRQYAAYGGATIGDGRFLVPAEPSRHDLTARPGLDAVVMEGPEPNGDPSVTPGSVPTVLPLGSEGHGENLAGDVDWWRVDLPVAGDCVFWTGPGAIHSQDDTVLTLLDQNGVVLQMNDDFHDLFSQIEGPLPAGTYYLAVEGFDPQLDIGTYTLDVVCTPAGVAGARPRIPEGAEPNGDPLAGGTPTRSSAVSRRTA